MVDAVAPATRERGWRRLLTALAAFLLLPATPLLATALPVMHTLTLVVAALAVCALLGWRRGGHWWLAAIWCLLAGWMATQPADPASSFDRLTRGWALLLAAAFGIVALVGGGRSFFSRALAAVGLALGVGAAVLALSPGGVGRTARVVQQELARRGDAVLEGVRGTRLQIERRAAPEDAATVDSLLDAWERSVTASTRTIPESAARVFPALLALESLAALALGWALYHRVSRARIGPPLAPLREFRFNDQLVWGLIVGITTLVIPTLEAVRGPGLNLLVFFGALYALRGLGVLAWFLTPARSVTGVLVGLALVILLRDGVAFALGLVGIGDTWLDWRGRARPT